MMAIRFIAPFQASDMAWTPNPTTLRQEVKIGTSGRSKIQAIICHCPKSRHLHPFSFATPRSPAPDQLVGTGFDEIHLALPYLLEQK
jgi:hypothetical protein